ncbi:MAG: single-stranded-DNA-specific exonuclease RecJ [Patescibacteria group bacterium]
MALSWKVGAGTEVVATLERLREVLLGLRGIDPEEAAGFFLPEYDSTIHAPLLMRGMRRAVDRLFAAREAGERVLVYGDYDADGVTATALLVTVLRKLGIQVIPYLPHRLEDGYGLNRRALERLLPEFDLLISADCGISNAEEIAYLASRGKDVIIVDHHELPAHLPSAFAILHPRLPSYPFPYLSGAGVAFKLAQGLLRDARARRVGEAHDEHALLDLAALGTIADVVPMLGENRAIARFGLSMLGRRSRVGLSCLLSECRLAQGKAVTAQDAAFRLLPRLNAAGRMDHPQPALDLLLTQSAQQARDLVLRLNAYNSERQIVTRRVMAEARGQVDPASPFVFVASTDWPAGVLGLAAAKLAEEFAKPAIVVGGAGDGAVGSARAGSGANVLQILELGRTHLLRLGGHTRAAGFSLTPASIPRFHQALRKAYGGLSARAPAAVVADAWVDHSLLSWDLLELIESFAPFGEGNQEPVFVARGLPVLDARVVGKSKDHLKLKLAAGSEAVDAIGFGLAQARKEVGRRIDALFTVETNEFGGRRQLSLKLREIAPAGRVRVQVGDAGHAVH